MARKKKSRRPKGHGGPSPAGPDAAGARAGSEAAPPPGVLIGSAQGAEMLQDNSARMDEAMRGTSANFRRQWKNNVIVKVRMPEAMRDGVEALARSQRKRFDELIQEQLLRLLLDHAGDLTKAVVKRLKKSGIRLDAGKAARIPGPVPALPRGSRARGPLGRDRSRRPAGRAGSARRCPAAWRAG